MNALGRIGLASTSGRCAESMQAAPALGTHHHRRLAVRPLLSPGFRPPPARTLHRCSSIVLAASAAPRRDPSLQQRWRSLKSAVGERAEQLGQLPPIAQILAVAAAVRALLQPLVDAQAALVRWKEEVEAEYNDYLAEETKLRWTWSKKNRKELAFIDSLPPFIFFFSCTLVYHAFVPVSALLGLAVPLFLAWAGWDRMLLSPIFLATLVMVPLKFPPWGWHLFCWVWPGVV